MMFQGPKGYIQREYHFIENLKLMLKENQIMK